MSGPDVPILLRFPMARKLMHDNAKRNFFDELNVLDNSLDDSIPDEDRLASVKLFKQAAKG